MTENETSKTSSQTGQSKSSRTLRWGKRILVGTVLVGLGVTAGAGLTVNAVQAHFWRGFNQQTMTPEEISNRVDRRVERILSGINGTTAEQKQKIAEIAKGAITDLQALGFAPREVRGKAMELLGADTFDAAALETLRAEQATKFDTASKRIVQAVSEAATVLTDEQRKQLVTNMSQRGWHRGPHGGYGRGGYGPRDDFGPRGHHGYRGHHGPRGGFWD
jgi:periplasmic protein CpxP/Spy